MVQQVLAVLLVFLELQELPVLLESMVQQELQVHQVLLMEHQELRVHLELLMVQQELPVLLDFHMEHQELLVLLE